MKKEKKDMTPSKSDTDPKNVAAQVSVDKKALAVERKRHKYYDPDETIVDVVRPYDAKDSHMPEIPELPAHLVKDILRSHLSGELTEQEVYNKLKSVGIDAAFPSNKIWLNRVLVTYFYGKRFATLLRLIKKY